MFFLIETTLKSNLRKHSIKVLGIQKIIPECGHEVADKDIQ